MRYHTLLVLILLCSWPAAVAHKPPGPVTTCQDPNGETYHDYIGNWNGLFTGPIGDGNLADCGPDNWIFDPFFNDNASFCQFLKSDPALTEAYLALCTRTDSGVSRNFYDYDNEWEWGFGGAVLAVHSGDGATWGSIACWQMAGHHSQNIYAKEWPDGSGPAFIVAADYSRTSPGPGPKGPRMDCGDTIVEPCDPTPPAPSSQPFPVNVAIDMVNAQMYALFGPSGSGTTCNVNDCAERNAPAAGQTTRSNPTGATHLVTSCDPGIDGTYMVAIVSDPDAPDVPMAGHIWTY